uniref:Uncharacterized protein n=1 Tax=Anguilla anguilla TaxID=7936 RepID=A0A0E9XUA4_ANGAN
MKLFATREGKLCCDLGLEMRLHFFHPQKIQKLQDHHKHCLEDVC